MATLITFDLPATPIHQFQAAFELERDTVFTLVFEWYKLFILGLLDTFLDGSVIRVFWRSGHACSYGV